MSNINPEANLIHEKQDRIAHYEQTLQTVGGYKGYVVKQLEAANIHGQDAIDETFAILESLSLKKGATTEEVNQKIARVIAGVAARRATPNLPKDQLPTKTTLNKAYAAFKNACIAVQLSTQKIFPTGDTPKTREVLDAAYEANIKQQIKEHKESYVPLPEQLMADDKSNAPQTEPALQSAPQGTAGSKKSSASKKSGEKKTGGTEQLKPHHHVGVPKAASTTSAAKAPEPAVLQQPQPPPTTQTQRQPVSQQPAQKPPSQAAHTRPVKPPIGTLKLDEKTSYKPLNLRKPLQELGLNQDIVIRVVNQKKPAASNGIYTRSEIEDIYASCCKEQELEASQETYTPPSSPKNTPRGAGISTWEDQSLDKFMKNLDDWYDKGPEKYKTPYQSARKEIFPLPEETRESVQRQQIAIQTSMKDSPEKNLKLFALDWKLILINARDNKKMITSDQQIDLEKILLGKVQGYTK